MFEEVDDDVWVRHELVPDAEGQVGEDGVLLDFEVSEAVDQQVPAQVELLDREVEAADELDHW